VKLSRAQQDVIDHMRDGWELAQSLPTGRVWLQKGGWGSGGEGKPVLPSTAVALMDRKLIELNRSDRYALTFKLTEQQP